MRGLILRDTASYRTVSYRRGSFFSNSITEQEQAVALYPCHFKRSALVRKLTIYS